MDKLFDLPAIGIQTAAALTELLASAPQRPGMILVVGCSTSEVRGQRIGSDGSRAVAAQIFGALQAICRERQLSLAVQCCEHLNRALVVERAVQERYALEEVTVVPILHAGGALATEAYHRFHEPVLVERIAAHWGLDIGHTLIGMHLRPVAIPVRLDSHQIGQAFVNAARTRPRLIGGARACYEVPEQSVEPPCE